MLVMIIQITVLVFAVIIHEVSHGYVAYMLGDRTAKEAGRLTLNPLPHIDPIMSVILPLMLIFSHAGFIIGGAKPVPINPLYFKHHKRDVMLVSLAGPGSNLILACLSIAALKLVAFIPILNTPGLTLVLYISTLINIGLAAFNLIPIPPLDGSKVLVFFMPDSWADKYLSIERYGIFIILIIFAIPGLRDIFFMPINMLFEFVKGIL
jgi:Zn-dependent protease